MKRTLFGAGVVMVLILGVACGQSAPVPEPKATSTPTSVPKAASEPMPTSASTIPMGCAQADIGARGDLVFDDETGMAIKDAYWRSETLDGEIFFDLKEGVEHERYELGAFDGAGEDRVTGAARLASERSGNYGESVSLDFRVVVAKEGYTTIARVLTATGNRCGVTRVDGGLVFRMVKGPPGKDDNFRNPR